MDDMSLTELTKGKWRDLEVGKPVASAAIGLIIMFLFE